MMTLCIILIIQVALCSLLEAVESELSNNEIYIYVSVNGDDSYNGTVVAPVHTLHRACSIASDIHSPVIIDIGGGTFTETNETVLETGIITIIGSGINKTIVTHSGIRAILFLNPNISSSFTFTNIQFQANSSDTYLITLLFLQNFNCNITFQNCLGSQTNPENSKFASFMYVYGEIIQFENCQFVHMHTTSNGVAIVPDIYALISNCTFLDMHSDKANPAVVAVFREGCVYNFTKCTFSKCSGFLAGALFLQQYLQGLNLDRCIFLNNQAQAEDLPEKGNDIYLYHEDPSEDEKILDKKIVHCISSSKNKRIGYYWNPSGDEYDKLLLNLE